MTEEELREKLENILVFDLLHGSEKVYDVSLAILTLIREAGWKSPEEVKKMCFDAMIMGRK